MNETGKLRTVFLWALLPIVCFALAIPLTKWIAKENDLSTSADYKNIAWDKVIASSPDVVFQDPDSIKYWGWKCRVSAKKASLEAVEITNLFPEFKAGNITAINKMGDTNPLFEVRNYNGTLYCGNMIRQDNGDFALAVNDYTKERSKIIPLGGFKGRLNVVIREAQEESPIIHVVGVLALFFCAAGLWLGNNWDEKNYSYVDASMTGVASVIAIFASVFILAKGENTMAWIVGACCVGEIGLLSGVLSLSHRSKKPKPKDIFSRNADKMRGFVFPIGEWKEVGGNDKMLINGDGTIYHTSQGSTANLRFKIGDNGNLIATDKGNDIYIIDYVARPSDPKIKPFMEIIYKGKKFTKEGNSYEYSRDCYWHNVYLVERTLGLPEKDGHFGWVIGGLGAVALFAYETLTAPKPVNNIWHLCVIFLVGLCVAIRNLWLILVIRKRKERVRLNCCAGFYSSEQLRQPKLTQYVRAALKKRGLTVDEWKSQNESK